MNIDERIQALTMNLELVSRDLETIRETTRQLVEKLVDQLRPVSSTRIESQAGP